MCVDLPLHSGGSEVVYYLRESVLLPEENMPTLVPFPLEQRGPTQNPLNYSHQIKQARPCIDLHNLGCHNPSHRGTALNLEPSLSIPVPPFSLLLFPPYPIFLLASMVFPYPWSIEIKDGPQPVLFFPIRWAYFFSVNWWHKENGLRLLLLEPEYRVDFP